MKYTRKFNEWADFYFITGPLIPMQILNVNVFLWENRTV